MSRKISHLAYVDPRAELADDVEVGPFCYVGPRVALGRGCRLDSHVTLVGHTIVGERNRFYPNAVVGADPQDISYQESETEVIIGDDNVFREGVTVNRGAEKEDHVTRIGNRNMLMANSHVAHNCHIHNGVILVNGVLLGGHVHVHDGAIISGNCVVHHFSTIGKLSFVSGGCRVPHDIPPFMLAAGSDNPTIRTINLVGMQRSGISRETISLIKRAYKMLYREFKTLDEIRELFSTELETVLPIELASLLTFIDQQRKGRMGRAREAFRNTPASADGSKERRAA
ncbi:Acyl-[acyl-carrier-protein]--UDP-N-acetylglucosamine O-acyltransferase [Polystyrenella longa]|uniref:Acyl-[acyl-carrier-protein]--UDP-N-acetylglucosamine O-acyltransferase n=1 Tax=Polystyrenella longa TaxID=2528007 RepID=A0A518CRB4_9PLAN|nr:acyl-ACP--UDP-N-acetylglucosamine O-acyltransferase [Polystyrenella longa]QDU81769.1 Acyl-[acyl-carrier-protein]--UDP-N-acetylglucosamine O-acyltransferase [Polystyrenella longa]